ncbi:unnamed protein product [Amaranthus hypochondriacus]
MGSSPNSKDTKAFALIVLRALFAGFRNLFFLNFRGVCFVQTRKLVPSVSIPLKTKAAPFISNFRDKIVVLSFISCNHARCSSCVLFSLSLVFIFKYHMGKQEKVLQKNVAEYVAQRATRIAHNKARMQSLGLHKISNSLMGSKGKEKQKKVVLEKDKDIDYEPESDDDDEVDQEIQKEKVK